MTGFINTKGVAALGTRLRRLSERLDRDLREIYAVRGIEFEASWFPVMTALQEHGALSVGELAAMTGVSQPAISQIRKRVEAVGYVKARIASADQRRHELVLTETGKRLVADLTPLWTAVAEASGELCRTAAPNLLTELDAIERALDAVAMPERVTRILNVAKQAKPAPKPRRAK
jgi:MarR family transcriptional regulator, organic hydroperoxide resistance regulator